MRALIVEHDHVSPIGPIGTRLAERGFELVHHRVVPESSFEHPGVPADFPDFTGFDAVVLLGAPWSVYDHELIGSWVLPEIEQARAAAAAGVPILGICFGGQLLAMANGGSVGPSGDPEIGWVDIETDSAIVPSGPWFQWHFDRWTVPPGAVELARNGAASQAFTIGRSLAVQFHPELTGESLRAWLDNGGATSAAERGFDVPAMERRTRDLEADAARRAALLVDGFLDEVATV